MFAASVTTSSKQEIRGRWRRPLPHFSSAYRVSGASDLARLGTAAPGRGPAACGSKADWTRWPQKMLMSSRSSTVGGGRGTHLRPFLHLHQDQKVSVVSGARNHLNAFIKRPVLFCGKARDSSQVAVGSIYGFPLWFRLTPIRSASARSSRLLQVFLFRGWSSRSRPGRRC